MTNAILTEMINRVRASTTYRQALELIPPSIKPTVREMQYELTTLLQYGRRDMFTGVAIETTSICNRRCTYCPNSDDRLRSKRPQKHMDMHLYDKIIGDLAGMDFQGRVALQHYGEPLEDPYLDQRVRTTKEKLPSALITMYSNGDKLTPDRLEKLVEAGIGQILVTNHNANGRVSPTLEKLQTYLANNPEMRKYCQVRDGIKTLSNRGGLVQIPEEKSRALRYCISDSHNFVIDVEGNVVMCANDYLGKTKLGDVNDTGIMEIWDCEKYQAIRSGNKKGRFTEEACNGCTGSV